MGIRDEYYLKAIKESLENRIIEQQAIDRDAARDLLYTLEGEQLELESLRHIAGNKLGRVRRINLGQVRAGDAGDRMAEISDEIEHLSLQIRNQQYKIERAKDDLKRKEGYYS